MLTNKSVEEAGMNARSIACVCLAVFAADRPGQAIGATESAAGEQDLASIFERIRQDVGNYEYQAARWRGDIKPKIPDPALSPSQPVIVCSESVANYDYDITKINVSLHAVASTTTTGGVGLAIPIGVGNVDTRVNGSIAHRQTKTILLERVVPYIPLQLQKFHDGKDYANLTTDHQEYLRSNAAANVGKTPLPVFPISDTLIALRKSLLQAAGKLPCFDVEPRETGSDSMTFEFHVETAVDPNVGFAFIVTANAGHKIENTGANTITITFEPHSKRAAKAAPKPANR
jgi:hypothetical protein